ncbi:hypothetical protein OIU79_024634 [Salix purpurea]|uniref:DUF7912 domain-containing protein n=1 Tax=Salix purpurea TaxID=77065 RepID=A0A9Q0NNI9_SALPP|nr:hypothetical protein OIU79_024634 [Salix purpurea]
MRSGRIIQHLLLRPGCRGLDFFSTSLSTTTTTTTIRSLSFFTFTTHEHGIKTLQNPFSSRLLAFFSKQPTPLHSSSSLTPRFLSTTISTEENSSEDDLLSYETTEDVESEEWEEEEEVEPKLGDGGDGGGVVLQGLPWGDRALSIAREVLLSFGDDIDLFAFKTTPNGYVYVRLDKLSQQYGCPSIEELESYCQEYRKRLEEVGALGEIPNNLAVEVSTPGAERILKVADDLSRFKYMPMRVCYSEGNGPEKNGVFFLDSVEMESENCVWKLADVKENRDPESKGRPLNRKRRDWRLTLPFKMHGMVSLYLDC